MKLIIKILLFILTTIFLELNKNTLLGFVLNLFLFMTYLYLSTNFYKDTKLYRSLLLFIAYAALFAFIVFISWPPTKYVPAVSNDDPKESEIITTEYGKVRGVLNKDGSVAVFAGIPYAKAPINELRWKEPQDPNSWPGTLICDHFMPMSMQKTNLPFYDSLVHIIGYHDYKISLKDNYRPPVSEDSLYLNVWKPHNDKKDLPVIVFIHGGSLQNGQAWNQSYNGEYMARNDVIFVNFAYRLGVFGFLADEQLRSESSHHTTGNYGLLDMIKALEWVRKNISSFGGDPNNITLAGESAGAASVSALCTSPLAKGLFSKVILESSTLASKIPPHSYRQLDEALGSGKQLKERYDVSDVEDLRKISADNLVKEEASQHHITVDGYAMLQDPYLSYKNGDFNETAILHGYNAKESGPFILFDDADMKDYEQRLRYFFGDYTDEVMSLYPVSNDKQAADNWAQIYGALFFNYPHYCLNRLAIRNDIPVYEYYFAKENGGIGPWHSGEMIYAYGNVPASLNYDASDRKLSQIMASYWINFARSSDPNGQDLPEWKQNRDSKTLLKLNSEIKTIDDKYLKLYAIIDRMEGFTE